MRKGLFLWLLILSAADKEERRITSETSQTRNRFVAAIADKIIIAHAELFLDQGNRVAVRKARYHTLHSHTHSLTLGAGGWLDPNDAG